MNRFSIQYSFTPEARALIPPAPNGSVDSVSLAGEHVPMTGDAVHLPWLTAHWFVVLERQFDYQSDGSLVLNLLLRPAVQDRQEGDPTH